MGLDVKKLKDRIAELEVDKTALMERDEKYCNTIAAMRAENEAVEAENQRLRDAAQAVVDSATPHYDRWVNGVTRVCINRLAALLGGGENG